MTNMRFLAPSRLASLMIQATLLILSQDCSRGLSDWWTETPLGHGRRSFGKGCSL